MRAIRESKSDEPVDMDDLFWLEKKGPIHKKYYGQRINTAALSVIADSILDALQDREDELRVLARHEVVLSSPSNPKSLDTQKKFDAAIGKRVAVRTHDPWNSNRSLYGVLVDRNTLDVYINQKGRLVTIPNNFVAGVELMEGKEFEEYEQQMKLKDDEGEEIKNEATEKKAHAELMKKRLADFEAEMKAVEEEYQEEMNAIEKDEDDFDEEDKE